jgi:hypothetical protein
MEEYGMTKRYYEKFMKIHVTIPFLIIFFFAGFALTPASISANNSTYDSTSIISLEINKSIREHDEQFEVLVKINSAISTRGAQFSLHYDPRLVKVLEVKEGNYYSDWAAPHGASTWFRPGDIDNKAGDLKEVVVVILGAKNTGTIREGTLAVITMESIKEKFMGISSFLRLSGVKVISLNANRIEGIVANSGQIALIGKSYELGSGIDKSIADITQLQPEGTRITLNSTPPVVETSSTSIGCNRFTRILEGELLSSGFPQGEVTVYFKFWPNGYPESGWRTEFQTVTDCCHFSSGNVGSFGAGSTWHFKAVAECNGYMVFGSELTLSIPPTGIPDWDIDGSGFVDIGDIGEVGNWFGCTGPTGWLRADVVKDGMVDITDIGEVGNHWNDSWISGSYQENLSFSYTYYHTFYLNQGQQYTFETRKNDPYASDPVMYVFKKDNQDQGSWVDDDSGDGYQSRIVCTPQHSGNYVVLLRACNSDYPGTSDFYKDGQLFQPDAPLAGNLIWCGYSMSSLLNYFTCKNTGDTVLFVFDDYSISPVKRYNDNYNPPSGVPHDWDWETASRVVLNDSNVTYALVSAFSSNSTGTCDLYMACENGFTTDFFPNLHSDDSIKAAPETADYNCIAWSGGQINMFIFPPDPYSPNNQWYDDDPLTAFDKYYGNIGTARYPGATDYEQTTDPEERVIDLWQCPDWGEYEQHKEYDGYTHASVRKPGNDQPHGYDWESKTGSNQRIFHPENALENHQIYYDPIQGYYCGYGHVVKYYKPSGTLARISGLKIDKGISEEESIALGFTAIETVEFTEGEKVKIVELAVKVPADTRMQFNELYEAWEKSMNDPVIKDLSYPIASVPYTKLIELCQRKGNPVWPLLFQKIVEAEAQGTLRGLKDYMLGSMLGRITKDKHPDIFEQIRADAYRYNNKGQYLVPGHGTTTIKHIQALLDLY